MLVDLPIGWKYSQHPNFIQQQRKNNVAWLQLVYPWSTQEFLRSRLNVSVRSRSNWNLEVLVFECRRKPEYPRKNISEQGREPTTNSTHIWRQRRDLNPDHIGGRRVLSTLRHPCSFEWTERKNWTVPCERSVRSKFSAMQSKIRPFPCERSVKYLSRLIHCAHFLLWSRHTPTLSSIRCF